MRDIVEASLWRRVLHTRPLSSDFIQQAIERFLLLLEQGHNMINMLLGRDNIRAVCSVKEGKRTPEAFSMTHVGDEGTRPGMLAQGMQTETTRVETYRWNISMISILITS